MNWYTSQQLCKYKEVSIIYNDITYKYNSKFAQIQLNIACVKPKENERFEWKFVPEEML